MENRQKIKNKKLTLAEAIWAHIPFKITCLRITPEGGGCLVFGLLGELRDNKLPTLTVSLVDNFSKDAAPPKSSSVPDREPQSGSARILSREGNLSTAGISYSASSNYKHKGKQSI